MGLGSPLSPVLNSMEHFEEMVIISVDHKPSLWMRYADDMSSVWPHGHDEVNPSYNNSK